MAAKSPLQRFYEQQLAQIGSTPDRGSSALNLAPLRPAEVYTSGAQSALPADLAAQVARANAAEKKAGVLGVVKKAALSPLKVAAGVLTTAGELTRGVGYGTWNAIAENILRDPSLVTDISGDGVVDSKDTILGQAKAALSPNEYVQGFGSFEPLKVNEGDGTAARVAKYVGAFGLDTALDPTTYVTAGTGVLGRTAAANLVGKTLVEVSAEQGAKTVATAAAKSALEATGEEALQKLATEGIKKTVATTAEAAISGVDNAASAALKGLSKQELTDIAAEQLATQAQAAFRRGGNTALRRELETTLGKEVGNQLFRDMPGAVRGGLRLAGKEFSSGQGGGQVLEKLGKPGEAATSLLEATTRARNVVGSKIPMGGRLSVAVRDAKGAAAAAGKDAAKATEQFAAERLIREDAFTQAAKTAATRSIDAAAREGAQLYDKLAAEHGGAEKFGRAVFAAYDSPNFDEYAATVLARPGVTKLERDAIEMARIIRDIPGGFYDQYQADLGDVFSTAESLSGSARRVETTAERARRLQTQEPLRGTAKGTRQNFKERTKEFWNEAENRWMTITEINQQVGRQKFEENPRKIFLETMKRLEKGVGDAVERRRLLEAGLIQADPKDLTMSGKRLANVLAEYGRRATSAADRVRAQAERAATVEPTQLQARALAQGADITDGSLATLMDEAQRAAAASEDAVVNKAATRAAVPSVQEVATLTEQRRALVAQTETLVKNINEESKRITPLIAEKQRQSAELAAELADQQQYWAERGATTIPKSSQDWLDATEKQILDIEREMEAMTEPIAAMKQEHGRVIAQVDAINESLVDAKTRRSGDLADLRRNREKLGRQAESAQRRLDTAVKRKQLADRAAERVARRQEKANKAAEAILERNAPIFAKEARINELMQRIAGKDVSQQDSLYQEMAQMVIDMSEETIQAMEARLAARTQAGLADEWEIASRLQNIERSKTATEKVKLRTNPEASVLQSFLDKQSFVRAGTEAGSVEADRVAGVLRGYFVDESVSRAMTAMYRVEDPTRAAGMFSSVYDPFEKLWRTYATVGRGPGFVTRNVLGGMYNSVLAGTGPEGFKRGLEYAFAILRSERAIKRALKNSAIPASEIGRFADSIVKAELDKLPELAGRSMWEWHNEMLNRGMFSSGITAAALGSDTADANSVIGRQKRDVFTNLDREALQTAGNLKKGAVKAADVAANNPWVNTWSSWSTHSERYLRASTFLGAVERNGSSAGSTAYADMLVKATQFDYGDLSQFERKVVRFVAPFYTWTKNNVPLQFRSLVNRPGVPAAILRGQQSAQDAFGGEGEWGDTANRFMPDYVQNALGFAGGGDTPMYYGIGAPLADLGRIQTGIENVNSVGDLAKLPLSIAGGLTEESVAQLNPLVKTGVESITGESLFTGASYGKEPVTGALASLVPGGTVNPDTGQREASAFAMAQARNLLPILGLVQRAVPSGANPILANPNYDDRLVSTWLSSIAGLGGLPVAAPMGTATESQIAGQASRQAKENNRRFEEAAVAAGLDPERLGKLIMRGATQEEIDQLKASGWLLAPYKRAELGLP